MEAEITHLPCSGIWWGLRSELLDMALPSFRYIFRCNCGVGIYVYFQSSSIIVLIFTSLFVVRHVSKFYDSNQYKQPRASNVD